jgi:hypothetical protein
MAENRPVKETLAVVGGILLLLGVTGGIQGIGTKLLQKEEFVPLEIGLPRRCSAAR